MNRSGAGWSDPVKLGLGPSQPASELGKIALIFGGVFRASVFMWRQRAVAQSHYGVSHDQHPFHLVHHTSGCVTAHSMCPNGGVPQGDLGAIGECAVHPAAFAANLRSLGGGRIHSSIRHHIEATNLIGMAMGEKDMPNVIRVGVELFQPAADGATRPMTTGVEQSKSTGFILQQKAAGEQISDLDQRAHLLAILDGPSCARGREQDQ